MASGKTWAKRISLLAFGGVLAITALIMVLVYLDDQSRDSFIVLTNPSPTNEDIKEFGTGELAAIAEDSQTGCGKYFASQGSLIAFFLKYRVDEKGVIQDAQYIAEKSLIRFVLDESVQTPRVKPTKLEKDRVGVEVTLSSRDFQRAHCLSVGGI